MNDDVLYLEDFSELLRGRTSGNIKVICPLCHEHRSNKKDRSLSINCSTLAYHCHYCDAKGYLKSRNMEAIRRIDRERKHMTKTYRKPNVKPNLQPKLDANMVEYFNGRGISEKTLLEAKVTKETTYFAQDNGKRGCIAFNYYLDGEHVNTKYRTRDKHFTFISGARIIPYNIDSISPKAYTDDEQRYCIITEGEADTLTYIECGYKHVISVPAGANSNLEWMDDFIESHFDNIVVFYISTDGDKKGVEAKNELVRRFGAEMCKVVEYPEGCKDINEVLVKYGREKVCDCFRNAVDVKLQGIEELYDVESNLDYLFANGLQRGATIGVDNVDRILSFKTGMLTVVTGIPSHGKTYFLNFILVKLNLLHRWKVAFFSPEFYPVTLHISQIIETLGGARFNAQNYNKQTYEILKDYVNNNFFWIDPDDTDINSVLERAKYLIRKKGIKALVIDPFNALTDKERKTQKQDEYISEFLQTIRWFARKYDVAIFLVMHPTKQQKLENGLYPVVDLYACKGASEIYDKADIGITVWRNEQENYAEMHVTKIKFRHLGTKGNATFMFNINNGRYVPVPNKTDLKGSMLTYEPQWDNTNYVLQKRNEITNAQIEFDDSIDVDSSMPFPAQDGSEPPF